MSILGRNGAASASTPIRMLQNRGASDKKRTGEGGRAGEKKKLATSEAETVSIEVLGIPADRSRRLSLVIFLFLL
jgi:hypothetical protein